MQITIQHQGQAAGPFTIEQVRAGVASGLYQASDLAWHEGAAGWVPLETVLAVVDAGERVVGTSKLAVWSLVLGVLSFTCVTALPAVICGHLARRAIQRSGGALAGAGMALAGMVLGYVFMVIMAVAMVAGLAAPMVIRANRNADLTLAINNARLIGLALQDFEMEYGDYPNRETAVKVAGAKGGVVQVGETANSRFRQLIQAEIMTVEAVFFCKAMGSRRPDEKTSGGEMLAPGECGFAFIEVPEGESASVRPLVVAPMVPGKRQFDPGPLGGKAVVLFTDGAVKSFPVERGSGRVLVNGVGLLDLANPMWGGRVPVVLLPE